MSRLRSTAAPQAAALKQRIEERNAEGASIRFNETLLPIIQWDRAEPGCEELAAVLMEVLAEIDVAGVSEGYYPGFGPSVAEAMLKHNFADHKAFRVKGNRTTSTAGFHIDSNSVPKMNGIIYLNEVGPDQGPFSYVIGSNRWAFDLEDRAIRKAMDKCAFGSQRGRDLFAAIPRDYQRKCSFGWDIFDGSPESDALLAAERAFTSDRGDLVLFDSDGVHRGGGVKEGMRLSILFNLALREVL